MVLVRPRTGEREARLGARVDDTGVEAPVVRGHRVDHLALVAPRHRSPPLHLEPGGLCNIELGEAFPGSTVVLIRSFTFDPFEVRVRPGERVTWINCDPEPHTSTADNGEWASPLLATGQAFTQTFATVGQFAYHCEPHPFMAGLVIVE